MHRYVQQSEIGYIAQDQLLCDTFNIFLSLPTFPRGIYLKRDTLQFYEISNYEQKHNDKSYQPVYRCSIGDLTYTRSILSCQNYNDTCQIVKLSSFYQSTIYFTYIFICSLNQYISKPFKLWKDAENFFHLLKTCPGYMDYLCWIDVYKSTSKASFQDIRLKYFRPNQINHVASVTFVENRGDLMESLLKNIATYWYPRLCNYLGELKQCPINNLLNYPELRQLSISAIEEFSGEEIHKLLIDMISYEELSGHVFQNFLLINKYFDQSKYLTFLNDCFAFYDGFSYDTVDIFWARRSAMKLISGYLMPGSIHYIYIPPDMLKEVTNASNPPYDDLFDSVIEYALYILSPCLQTYYIEEIEKFDDISEEVYVPQDSLEDIECANQEVHLAQKPLPVIKEPPQESKEPRSDGLIGDILRNRNEYERFRYFLTSLSKRQDVMAEQGINPVTDFDCYIDIEKFKIAKVHSSARDELATNIKQTYLTKKYFFGPASPAPRSVQINILGGSGQKMAVRPPSPVVMEVQRCVLQRIINKWLRQYRETEEFQRRQLKGGSKLNRRSVNTKNDSAFVFMDSKSRANAHVMLQLRKTLMDPVKSKSLKRYAKAKNERLYRDIEFWVEVQKYKDMHHRHSSQSLIRKKIDIIIDCFLDSAIPPTVQISVPSDIAHKTAESRYDIGPYIFRQSQSNVTKSLCNLWTDYNAWCDKYENEPLPFPKLEFETQQKRLVKQLLKQKQRDEERERAYLDTVQRSSSKRASRSASIASSATLSDNIRMTIDRLEENMPTIHWKFSDTIQREIGEKEKRNQYLLKDILDKGMFQDDEGFRKYLTEKLHPQAKERAFSSSEIFDTPLKGLKGSLKASMDSTTSSKSCKTLTRVHSRSNFDRTQLASINEKLAVPARSFKRHTAPSDKGPTRPNSRDSVSTFCSGISGISLR